MRAWALAALVLLFWVAACGGGAPADGPPEVRYGEDVCDECHMIINDARFAAAYRTVGGDVRRFDDIGDMVVYYIRTGEEVAAFWVHDYGTKAWVRAEEAVFVRSPSVQTPMGHGFVAFAGRDDAETFVAQHGGEVMGFEELLKVYGGR